MSNEATYPLHWENIIFLSLVHLAGGFAVYYQATVYFSWATVALALIGFFLCHLAITAGYHRLYAHRSYQAAKTVQIVFLLLGAAVFQGSANWWASIHRRHHKNSDREGDPHNIGRGFWFAHVGWLLRRYPVTQTITHSKDLLRNKLVRWQHKYCELLGLLVGFGAPTMIAWTWGDPWGGLLVGGSLRLVVQFHTTWSINSFAHSVGSKSYDPQSSARNSTLVAIFTVGEGYHDYHHRFPGDFRLGIHVSSIDPGKWLILLLEKVGLAWDLRRISAATIEKARKEMLSV